MRFRWFLLLITVALAFSPTPSFATLALIFSTGVVSPCLAATGCEMAVSSSKLASRPVKYDFIVSSSVFWREGGDESIQSSPPAAVLLDRYEWEQ